MRRMALILIMVMISGSAFADMGAVLDNGLGARSAAMGLAQVAASDGVDAVYWNPAILTEAESAKLSTSASEIYGVSYKTLAFASPGMGGGWGILVLSAEQGGIPETTLGVDGHPVVAGDFGYDAKAVYLSYAKGFGKLSVGTSLKYLTEGLAGKGARGFGGDVGVFIKPSEILSLGAKIENVLAPQMKWDTSTSNTDGVETGFRLGASLRPKKQRFLISGDLHLRQGKSAQLFMGGEYNLAETLALRSGIFDGRLSFGLGIDYQNFALDYSYAKGNDYLEDSHRVSLSFSLGPSSDQRLTMSN